MAITLDAISLGVDELSDGEGEDETESSLMSTSTAASPQPPLASLTASGERSAGAVIRTPFGSFTVGERIGRGAFAHVYKALWNETGFHVAIKCFDTSQMTNETIDSVLIEVTLLGKLKHPNILRIIGYHREEDNLYLMLEFAESGSLLKKVKERGGLNETLVCVYVDQVLKALAYLHSSGIIHRDLKAANILLTKSGDVKLADFGVAAVMGDADKHFTIVGSPYWMAPEIISATGHSVSSDIWSLGCTIVELLTGEPPYFGLNPMTAMFKIVQNPAPIPPDCSAPLRDFLTKCFEKDPTKRPSAESLLRHPWFDQPYTASMEVSAVREHVMAYQAEHSSKGRPSASTSGRGSRPMTRERRDSKVVVPEYQIERFDQPTSGPIGIAAAARAAAASGAGDENSSSSESSMHDSGSLEQLAASASAIPTSALSVSTSSGLPAPRTERPMWQPSRSAHSSSGHERQQSCPPPSIAALVGPGASRPSTGARQPILRVSSQTTAAPPAAPTAPAPQPPTVTAKQSASPTTSSSGTSAREEEMAREIEDLKRRLMQVEGSSPVVVPAAPTSSAPPPPMSPAPLPPVMKSLKAQFIRDLQPTVADVPPSTMRVCCISAIGSSLWVGGADGTVTIYKLPSSGSIQASALEPHTSFKLHRTRIYSIIQVGTRRVWCSSEEGEIYIVPPRQPSEARHIAVHDIEHRMIKCLGYVPGDRARVWSCAPALSNSQIVVLSKGGHIKYKLTIKQAINSVTLSPSLETVWLGCYGAIIVCDALRGDLRREIKLPDAAQCKKVTQVTPVGDLIWCSAGKQIIVVDPYTFKIERVLQQSSDVERIAVCEGIVFAGDLSAQVQTYDPVSMTHVHTLSLPLTDSDGRAAPVKALCVSAAPGRPPAIFAGSSVTSNICVWSAKQT